ncbi:RHS repeat-associated core domain-containing protein, partial [Lonsdalea quercina]|uniref:RHS repeat-associated core domain-containing protein n=1 Tax=Lonsdalea quercina TaxID=71657 RepID=UPI0039759D1F
DFVSSAPNGAPQALYDSEGELRWQAPKATLWGQRAVSKTESADPELAFAGQLRDSESGLCYNRFRYYDPAGGGYISPDPIGVLGGESNYGYVHNPKTWIDPLGLAKCPPVAQTSKAANGLDYRSNPKHTLGADGNSLKAGIEPRNSLDLFGNSVQGKNGNRFALDSEGNVHRFAPTNDGTWHWNGSTGQSTPRPNLTSKQVGNDIIKKFNLPRKGW